MNIRLKSIPNLQLQNFRKPTIPGNRGFVWRASWYLINVIFFQSAIFSLIPGSLKASILRKFGAKIGRGFVCKPRVSIKYPWLLEVGDYVWIGELVWIDNHCLVRLGNNCCVSQGVYLFTGNHDWTDPSFPFFARPIIVGDGVWITAFLRLGPGTEIPSRNVALNDHCSTRREINNV
jgi:putative colanic acid biosynthesis acetyltransferase WcaF